MRRSLFIFLITALVAFGLYRWLQLDQRLNEGRRTAEHYTPAEGPKIDPKDIQVLAALDAEYTQLVQAVVPSVVSVTTSRRVPAGSPVIIDPFEFLFRHRRLPGPQQQVKTSLGSGVIVSLEGHIITNHHVIANMDTIEVQLTDGRVLPAQLIGSDEQTDIAIVKISAEKIEPLHLGDSDAVRVGQMVFAVGNPFGLQETVTQGIISAKARAMEDSANEFFQTDAAINPGNSGGALVDLDGKLVGINSAIYSRSGGSMGIGFAIPVNMVKSVIVAARQGGATVRRPWLGATLQSLTKDIADNLGIDRPTGALVVTVAGEGPAFDAGLKRGDVITAVDGQSVEDAESVGFRLAVKPLGGAATLSVLREGRTLNLPLKLAAAPEIPPRDVLTIRSRSPFQGAEVMNMSPAVAEELSLEGAPDGVVVASVGDGSTAAEVGVQKGDVVVAVNGLKIATTRDLEKACAEHARLWDLTIKRGAQTIRTQLGG